jgi:hypothetical protein
MELDQHHIIKFLYIKDFKLNDITMKLSNLYKYDTYIKSNFKYEFHQFKFERIGWTYNMLIGDHLSMNVKARFLSTL